ncbi:hypothetical protein ACFSJW_15295 [Flavobacterium artemisiae]|uniref:Trigger factor C-terminal domain-containing protein n=1 Tax=Flavobacterium artemisiae TaxID=2126556 RepID=A0ABW4HIP1_9FLAO
MKQGIDFFNGMSTEDLHERFMQKLYSKTEFIQYNDPDDFFDPEQEYGNHITQCISEERDFIRQLIRKSLAEAGIKLTDDQVEEMVKQKREEINLLTGSAIEDYIEKVSVTYIDPICEFKQKFLLRRLVSRFWKFIKSLNTK